MQHEDILSFFSKYIEKELGIIYATDNYFQLQNRLNEIGKLVGADSLDKLHVLAQDGINGQFKQLLLDIATNNETSFFRDQKVFTAIENTIIPAIAAGSVCMPKISIWSAASSSGQEALSVAMTLLEWSKKNQKSLNFEISGTDISDRILTKARNARYSQLEIQRGLPLPLMTKYFKKDETDSWTASADLKKHVDYRKLNLTEPFRFTHPFEIILCRNVLIYQNVERKISILKRMHTALAPGGFLILGAAESLIGLSEDFSSVNADGVVLYRKKTT
jgi:chemotaxis protein methyltransferase CheR